MTPSTSSRWVRRQSRICGTTLGGPTYQKKPGRLPVSVRHQWRLAARAGGRVRVGDRSARGSLPCKIGIHLTTTRRPGRRRCHGRGPLRSHPCTGHHDSEIQQRCGNMDLTTLAANLALKLDKDVLVSGRSPQAAHRGEPLRLRSGQPGALRRPALRRPGGIRPQGRHARSCRSPHLPQLRAHHPGERG